MLHRAFYLLTALILIISSVALCYRHYYYGHAGALSKALCENKPVGTGAYGACIERHEFR